MVPPALRAAAQAGTLISKRIPSTGQRIATVGIGGNSIISMEQYEAVRPVLARMHEMGGQMIDTSDNYGEGEAVIGRALAELGIRKQMFVATKFDSASVASASPQRGRLAGREAFERSLSRLQSDYVDLLYAHAVASAEPLMPLMREMKSAGKARYIGMTAAEGNDRTLIVEAMRKYPVDFIQVDYSIGNRLADQAILPLALERKMAVVAVRPLGGHSQAPGGHEGSYLSKLGNRPLPTWAAEIGASSWSQFLLKYVISHPAVTCVAAGTTVVDHLVDNQLAGHGKLPNAAMRRKMQQYWDTLAVT